MGPGKEPFDASGNVEAARRAERARQDALAAEYEQNLPAYQRAAREAPVIELDGEPPTGQHPDNPVAGNDYSTVDTYDDTGFTTGADISSQNRAAEGLTPIDIDPPPPRYMGGGRPMVPTAVVGGPFEEPVRPYIDQWRNSHKDIETSAENLADVRARRADEQYDQVLQNRLDFENNSKRQYMERSIENAQIEQRIQAIHKEADDISKEKVYSGRVFQNPLAVLGAVLVAIGSAYNRRPDLGVSIINGAIQRDLDVQQANIDNRRKGLEAKRGLLADFMRVTGNRENARLLADTQMKQVAASKLQEAAMKYEGSNIKAETQAKINQLRSEVLMQKMEVSRRLYKDFQEVPKTIADAIGPLPRPYSNESIARSAQAQKTAEPEPRPSSTNENEQWYPSSTNEEMQQARDLGDVAEPKYLGEAEAWAPKARSVPQGQLPAQKPKVGVTQVDVGSGDTRGMTANEIHAAARAPKLRSLLTAPIPGNPPGWIATEIRNVRAYELLRHYATKYNELRPNPADPNDAEWRASQAKAYAQKMNDQAMAEGRKEIPKVAAEASKSVETRQALASTQQTFHTLQTAMGSRERMEEFMRGLHNLGKEPAIAAAKLHELAQGMGFSDEKARAYRGLAQQLQWTSITARHSKFGATLSKSEEENWSRFFSPDASAATIERGLNVLSQGAKASWDAAVQQAGGNPYAPLIYLAGQRSGAQSGQLNYDVEKRPKAR